ncbi:MAG TPA: hypothetical protein VK826_13710 [Bacteroidia bacterium]|nr:hypothetical protein [Bacteroidia bacterium]
MKSRYILFLLLFFFSFRSSAQIDHIEGGLYVEHFQLGYRSQQQIGGQLHIGIWERFTLNWQIGIGPAAEGGFYAHLPAGMVGGIKLMRDRPWFNSIPMLNNLGVLLMVCPEGVGYYVTEGKMRMHVSVNPLGFDYWLRRDPNFEHGRMSGSVVFRCRLMSNLKWPIYIAPQIAATVIYRLPDDGTLDRIGFRAGVTIGFSNEDRD